MTLVVNDEALTWPSTVLLPYQTYTAGVSAHMLPTSYKKVFRPPVLTRPSAAMRTSFTFVLLLSTSLCQAGRIVQPEDRQDWAGIIGGLAGAVPGALGGGAAGSAAGNLLGGLLGQAGLGQALGGAGGAVGGGAAGAAAGSAAASALANAVTGEAYVPRIDFNFHRRQGRQGRKRRQGRQRRQGKPWQGQGERRKGRQGGKGEG